MDKYPVRISVIMSVFNGELYLHEAIESILNQSFVDFEFIIINDCSTDSTAQIIKSYTDSRINIINNPTNLGLTRSLNIGLRTAKGKYIARMDADDISLPNRFTTQFDFMEKNPTTGVCGTWFTIFDESSEETIKCISEPKLLAATLLVKNQLGHPTVFMRSLVLTQNQIFYDESLKTSQDYNLWLRLSAVTQLANIEQPLVRYRIHKAQVISTHKDSSKPYTHAARIKYLQSLGIGISTLENEVLYKTYFNEPIALSEFNALVRFFSKVQSINRKINIYSTHALKTVFSKKIKDVLRNYIEQNNNSSFKLFFARAFYDFSGLLKRAKRNLFNR